MHEGRPHFDELKLGAGTRSYTGPTYNTQPTYNPQSTYNPPSNTTNTPIAPPAGLAATNVNFNDPTQSYSTGSSQWYAGLGQDTANIEQMVEKASGYNVTDEWLQNYGALLPTYDASKEEFAKGKYSVAEGRYDLAGEAYGTAGDAYALAGKGFGQAKEGYQFELGDIFGQAGAGTMDLLSSWEGGGQTMTGKKRRQRGAIGETAEKAAGVAKRKLGGAELQYEQAGLQYDLAGQAYTGAGLTLESAGITKAESIYGIREDFAEKFSDAVSGLATDEAFVDLETMGFNTTRTTNYSPTNTYPSSFGYQPPQSPNVWDPNTNTWSNQAAAQQQERVQRNPLDSEYDPNA